MRVQKILRFFESGVVMTKEQETEDIKHKSERQRNLFERILESVPGFRSYLSKERSRESDQKEREYISRTLQENVSDLRDLSRELSRSGALNLLDELETVEKRIRRLADRIKHANYGYSGFFDTIKVEDPELTRLYEFDTSMLEATESVRDRIDALDEVRDDEEKLEQRIKILQDRLKELDRTWNERKDLITGKREDAEV